ncbi:MAG TPA: hypothetical protein VGB83_03310 [Actinomycetota bacterium]
MSRAGTRKRAAAAFERIAGIAQRDTVAAERVAIALEAAAEELEAAESAGTLPAHERAVWATVGAPLDDESALPRAKARASVRFADLVASSIVGDAAVARKLGGVDPSRISQRLSERSLYAFEGPKGRCFPRWQFRGGKPLPGLKVVFARMAKDVHPLVVDHWFTTPNVDLAVEEEPVSPADWLATGGRPDRAAELAEDL